MSSQGKHKKLKKKKKAKQNPAELNQTTSIPLIHPMPHCNDPTGGKDCQRHKVGAVIFLIQTVT